MKIQRVLCLWLCAAVVQAAPKSRAEFQDNRLRVDGKPFFIYGCWGTPDRDYKEFRRRHFNTAFFGWKSAPTEGPKAAEAGLMAIPYPYAPGWGPAMKKAMESIVDKDWVLAWNIGDDLSKKEHVAAALRVRDEIRGLDPQRRPVMFDAIGLYGEFAKIPDMWCAYAYALAKPALMPLGHGKPGGLSEYGDWLKAKRLLGRPDGFFWTWAQCHTQIWYNMKYLSGTDRDKWRPSRFPDGDHLRLIFGHAVSAGCRGFMWFVMHYFQDSHLGRDRYARASTIGCELDVVGPLIAQGRTGERLTTSDPSVWATPIDFPGGRLICLVKTGEDYQYQPDAAVAQDVRVEPGAPGAVYQIGHEFRELPQPRCSFDLTSWLLVTKDQGVVTRLRAKHREVLPDLAAFHVEELQARIAKVEPVFEELGQEPAGLRRARELLEEARQCGDRHSRACRLADEGLRSVRVAQHSAWRSAWSEDVQDLGFKKADFYVLPQHAQKLALIKKGDWGENLLANGTFESDEGWAGAKLGHTPKGKAAFIAGAGRDGSRSLRLCSDKPTIYQGEPRDWVTVNVVSPKIPVEPDQILEIAAWVRLPKLLEQTQRGVTVALFAYTADGKRIHGYGTQSLEAVQVARSDGWQRMRLVVPLRAKDAAAVAARLALCGVGEAYLDDVTVRKLLLHP